jgi:hypothetical protein
LKKQSLEEQQARFSCSTGKPLYMTRAHVFSLFFFTFACARFSGIFSPLLARAKYSADYFSENLVYFSANRN